AQFGRGVQQDVAERLLSRFAECLENEIVGGGAEEEAEAAATSEAGPSENGAAAEGATEEEEQPRRRIIQQDQEVEPLDLGEASREAVLKRIKQAAPVAAGVVTLVVVIWLVRRR
ncbi:MAG: hypothetical protein M3N00_03190, partial [Actinomycetota bacterium]|nr:hypothetical protein [Actinomycetota bacterium]